MASKNYVVINGRAYNTITGMVMDDIKIEKSEIEGSRRRETTYRREEVFYASCQQASSSENCH